MDGNRSSFRHKKGDSGDIGEGSDVQAALVEEGDGVPPRGLEPCVKCGEEMLASPDPDTLLSFPMRFRWDCSGCGHAETRGDRHEAVPESEMAQGDEPREF